MIPMIFVKSLFVSTSLTQLTLSLSLRGRSTSAETVATGLRAVGLCTSSALRASSDVQTSASNISASPDGWTLTVEPGADALWLFSVVVF